MTTGKRCHGPAFLAADGRRLDRHRPARIVRRIAHRAGNTNTALPQLLRQRGDDG